MSRQIELNTTNNNVLFSHVFARTIYGEWRINKNITKKEIQADYVGTRAWLTGTSQQVVEALLTQRNPEIKTFRLPNEISGAAEFNTKSGLKVRMGVGSAGIVEPVGMGFAIIDLVAIVDGTDPVEDMRRKARQIELRSPMYGLRVDPFVGYVPGARGQEKGLIDLEGAFVEAVVYGGKQRMDKLAAQVTKFADNFAGLTGVSKEVAIKIHSTHLTAARLLAN